MNLQSTTQVNADFYNNKYIIINAKQYDRSSRFLEVTCYNNGTLFPINSSEHSAYIRYKKADEYSVFNFCEINRKGKILVELTEQMLACDGICFADLVLVNKGCANVDVETGEIVVIDNSAILSTMTFCINVSETAVVNSDIESTYEFNLVNTTLEKYWADFEDVMKTSKSYAIGNSGIRDGEDKDNAKWYYEQSSQNAKNADTSKTEALEYRNLAQSYAVGGTGIRNEEDVDNAKYYYEQSLENASAAQEYFNKTYTNNMEAFGWADSAMKSAETSMGYATIAQNSMNSAIDSASSASKSAMDSHDYYIQTEAIVNGLNGAFLPKGTVTFAELLELKNNGMIGAGDLYHISDNFTTDENFRVSGEVCGAGTSVYYTVDDKFDYFVGATVAGIKGENETEYRTGVVNITPENVGAISSANIATVDEVKNYLGI